MYSGTEVIQNRKVGSERVTALVIRTNFDTMKGSLIKSILYPKPNRFSFHADSMKFIGVLAIISVLGFIATIPASLKYLSTHELIVKALDLVTITVPPALPAAMSIGIVFALARLRKDKIFCIDPKRINVAGRVKTMVFDKTGTLTEDSLKFSGVTVTKSNTFEPLVSDLSTLDSDNRSSGKEEGENSMQDYAKSKANKQFSIQCMVSCHCIAEVQGRYIGDPLDIEMFEATGWTMHEGNHEEDSKYVELARFEPPTGKV